MIKFLYILDKGYRGNMASLQSGHGVALQPPLTKCDCRFSGKQPIFVDRAAHDGGGNERAVRVCMQHGLSKWGFFPGMSSTRLTNA